MNPKYPTTPAEEQWPDALTAPVGEALKPITIDPMDRALMRSRLLARVRTEKHASSSLTIQGSEGDWEPFSPRVQIKILRHEPESTSYLLKLDPGAVIWPHHHRQDEECMVMEGEVIIGDIRASAGTFHLAYAGVDHVPIRSETGATLYLRGAMPSIRDLSKRNALKYLLTGN
jgi:hypothetical protein